MFKRAVVRYLSTLSKNEDLVSIRDLKVDCITGKDFWSRPVLQPIEISIDLKTSFKKAAQTDDLKYSLNYATISRNVLDDFKRNQNKNFRSLELINDHVFDIVLSKENGSNGESGTVTLKSTKSEIRCGSVELVLNKELLGNGEVSKIGKKVFKVNGLKLLTIIGVFNFERLQKQIVDLNIETSFDRILDSSKLIREITTYVESAQFKTVEALVENVAYIVLKSDDKITDTKVAVWKPNAILFSDGVGVSINRDRSDLLKMKLIQFDETSEVELQLPNFNSENTLTDTNNHIIYVAFGSNQGNPFENINLALEKLNERGIQLLSTSTIYESKPMYYLDQLNFYNGVIKCSTTLKPQELLSLLKEIEYQDLQRVKEFANGPRSIDLDILLYDDLILNESNLKIPHISMIDRSFVLAPLCELISPEAVHPVTAETYHSHLSQLLAKDVDPELQESNKLINVVPYRGGVMSFDTFTNKNKTLVMGILNITPDSFSDGGANLEISNALETVDSMIANDVDIIDIGGCSTRPGSTQVSEDEELARVIPVISEIRKFNTKVIISIDTYRSRVAEEAIKAGANIINDISAGQFDENMFDIVAKLRVPYIINHTRGNIENMNKLTDYSKAQWDTQLQKFDKDNFNLSDEDEKFASILGEELLVQINKAFSKGVYKWQLILDPGIGFAKNTRQNIATIRTTPYLKQLSFQFPSGDYVSMERLPVLLAPSRKKFIGNITGITKPSDRLIGNCSALMACIGFGGDIIRTHDYKETNQVRALGDAIYRD